MINWLTLFKEIITDYYETHMKRVDKYKAEALKG
jgi:hypothetical protein